VSGTSYEDEGRWWATPLMLLINPLTVIVMGFAILVEVVNWLK
jgi:hypothetical protein